MLQVSLAVKKGTSFRQRVSAWQQLWQLLAGRKIGGGESCAHAQSAPALTDVSGANQPRRQSERISSSSAWVLRQPQLPAKSGRQLWASQARARSAKSESQDRSLPLEGQQDRERERDRQRGGWVRVFLRVHHAERACNLQVDDDGAREDPVSQSAS